MNRNTLAPFAFVLAAAVLAPLFALAASSGSVTASSGTASSGVAIPAQACLAITKNLGIGMRGTDVSALQSFLAANTSYNGGTTGYFGPLTRAAVREWQTAHGISPTGFVGPISRSVLTCTDDSQGGVPTSVPFSASPSSGQASLVVTFSATPKDSGVYIVAYGDGTNSGPLQSHCLSSNSGPNDPLTMSCEVSATHTYQSTGTYTATLSPYVSCLYATSGPRCMIAVMMLGQAQVVVH
jgi:peptidoglycan hydrolase-like protein with peptidoglycan-binding domain